MTLVFTITDKIILGPNERPLERELINLNFSGPEETSS